MRVITGTAKGRRLATLPGLNTRPTSGVVKEAMFSIIQFEIEGANVLDLFAGSGQMGIEALSRGARHCVFVDNAKASIAVLRRNLEHTGFLDKARVVTAEAIGYLRAAQGPFDIAFLDPPYGDNFLPKALAGLSDKMSDTGVILCESPKDLQLPEMAGDIPMHREYRHGKSKITVYRRIPEE